MLKYESKIQLNCKLSELTLIRFLNTKKRCRLYIVLSVA